MSTHKPQDEVLDRPETVKREKHTPPCRVLLINDDYTPMDFVIEVLMDIFGKNVTEARVITLKVHVEGSGLAGVYPFEIAETKVEEVHDRARAEGHPLKAILEEGDA